jgi:uncharacterized protein with HEPN domain
MNPINKNYAYLWDMLEACKKIQKFSQDISEKDYVKDILRQSAIERQLEILGEAARRISLDYQQEHSHILWGDIIGQRNIIAHQYEKVDQKRIWLVVTKNIPSLISQLELLIPPIPPER